MKNATKFSVGNVNFNGREVIIEGNFSDYSEGDDICVNWYEGFEIVETNEKFAKIFQEKSIAEEMRSHFCDIEIKDGAGNVESSWRLLEDENGAALWHCID